MNVFLETLKSWYLISPFYRWRNWGSGLSHRPEFVYLVSSWARIWSRRFLIMLSSAPPSLLFSIVISVSGHVIPCHVPWFYRMKVYQNSQCRITTSLRKTLHKWKWTSILRKSALLSPPYMGFPGGSVVKNSPSNTADSRDVGLIPGLEDSLE